MAPRNMAAVDCNRYLLRACKQQSSHGKIDASNITTKFEFLQFLGLTKSENIIEKNCDYCNNNCKCSDSVTSSDINMTNENKNMNNFNFKKCWVVVASEKCTICKNIFKCQSDLDYHIRKKHQKKSKKRTRIVLKIGHEVVTENYVKKRYLQLSNNNNNNSSIITTEDKNINDNSTENLVNNSVSSNINTSTSITESLLNSDDSNEDKRQSDSVKIKSTEYNYSRTHSTSSADADVELLNCSDTITCCGLNTDTLQKNKENINFKDQNNNNNNDFFCSDNNNNLSKNNNYLSDKDEDSSMNDDNFTSKNNNNSFKNINENCIDNTFTIDDNTLSNDNDNNTVLSENNNNNILNENCSLKSEDIECCSRSISVQTPSYWDYQTFTLLEYSRTLEANRMKDIKEKSILTKKENQDDNIITIDDDIEESILEDKIKKFNDETTNYLSKNNNNNCCLLENNDYSSKIIDDDSMEGSDDLSMGESDDDLEIQEISQNELQLSKKSLSLTDAIKSLIDTENSMQDYNKSNNNNNNNNKIKNIKNYEDDIDDDISYVRMQMEKEVIDCEYDSFDISKFEKVIDDNDVSIVPLLDCQEKNYNDDYDYVDYELASLKQLAKTKSINDEFDNESRSWEKPDRNRLSIITTPIQFYNQNNSSILIKEEISIDHFTFDRE